MLTPNPHSMILPWRTAIAIAYKNIRLRLGRSLIVTSSIVLAVAFLISILVTDATLRGMRQWITASPASIHDAPLHARQQALESLMRKNGVPATPAEIENDRIQNRWVLGLALLVAFIGILNAMLMSVTERFREIGTMKCLGALDGFIVRLFVLESLFQGLAGTVIGIIVGAALALASLSVSYGRYAWTSLPAHDLFNAALFCFIVGIGLTVAGAVYPAWQAARMQPIEAMRVET